MKVEYPTNHGIKENDMDYVTIPADLESVLKEQAEALFEQYESDNRDSSLYLSVSL